MKTTENLKNDVMKKIRQCKRQRARVKFFTDKILSVCLLASMLLPTVFHIKIFREPDATPTLQQQTITPTPPNTQRIHRPFEESQLQ